MKPRVNVIISTYNGARFIRSQLDSVLGQSYGNICIFVRDDGSTDGTRAILEEYEKRGDITLFCGENIGFCASFFDLLAKTSEGTYWSFCDQDDVWSPNKISLAVSALAESDPEKPALFFSLSRLTDEDGNPQEVLRPAPGSVCFRRMLTGCFGPGMSVVINGACREKMLLCEPDEVGSHDWLAEAICLGFGEVYLENVVCVRYRRLRTSVSLVSLPNKFKWLGEMLSGRSEIKRRNEEFFRNFEEELSPENRRLASQFCFRHYEPAKQFRKAFAGRAWRPDPIGEAVMRFLMLIGKI